MKKLFVFSLSIVLISTVAAQNVLGKWTTYDDETKQAKSYVEIYEKEGLYYGKILNLVNYKGVPHPKCIECQGEKKDSPIEGLVIIEKMKKDGKEFKGGTILDPKNGKTYICKFYLDEKNPKTLVVRGYIGPFSRAQYWKR